MMLRNFSLLLMLSVSPLFAAENIKAVGAVAKANIKAVGAVSEANIKAFGAVDNTGSSGTPASPLFAEQFEGANGGYDNAGWTTSGTGLIQTNYTGVILHGTETMRFVTPDSNQSYAYSAAWSAGNERFIYFLFRPVSTPGAGDILQLWDSGFSSVSDLQLTGTGALQIAHGSATATTVSTMSDGTTYHVWVTYNNSADTANVGFSTTGTRPTSGNAFAQTTAGTSTTNAERVFIGFSGFDGINEVLFDRIYVDDVQIGDNP
jgi:hypothetical protein